MLLFMNYLAGSEIIQAELGKITRRNEVMITNGVRKWALGGACSAVLCACLVSVSAEAGKPIGNTPSSDNFAEAVGNCGADYGNFDLFRPNPGDAPITIQAFACQVLFKTDGTLIDGWDNCDANEGLFGEDKPNGRQPGNGFVDYFGRNCAALEATLLSKMATVVNKIQNFLDVSPGKSAKTQKLVDDAHAAACTYADKFADFDGLKIDQGDEDLDGDAHAIAAALDGSCY